MSRIEVEISYEVEGVATLRTLDGQVYMTIRGDDIVFIDGSTSAYYAHLKITRSGARIELVEFPSDERHMSLEELYERTHNLVGEIIRPGRWRWSTSPITEWRKLIKPEKPVKAENPPEITSLMEKYTSNIIWYERVDLGGRFLADEDWRGLDERGAVRVRTDGTLTKSEAVREGYGGYNHRWGWWSHEYSQVEHATHVVEVTFYGWRHATPSPSHVKIYHLPGVERRDVAETLARAFEG